MSKILLINSSLENPQPQLSEDDLNFLSYYNSPISSSQTQLDKDFLDVKTTPLQVRTLNLIHKLSLCGRWATKKFYCKPCEKEGHEALLKVSRTKFHCEIRLCPCPECVVQRFASQLEELKSIKRLSGLRSLWHCSIGFPHISEEEFKTNFSSYKKKYELILYSFFKKLRRKGISFSGLRVLDFSFVNLDKGTLYPHFHLAMLPIEASQRREVMIQIKATEKSMNSKPSKNSLPFHFESYGYKNKEGIMAYISKRASGLYKYTEDSNRDYASGKGKLMQDIKNKVYFTLSDILTPEEYMGNFYNRRHYVTFGGLPHGSILTDNSESDMPSECKFHGHLDRKDIRVEIEFEERIETPHHPPDLEPSGIKIERIGRDLSRNFNEEIPDSYYESYESDFESTKSYCPQDDSYGEI